MNNIFVEVLSHSSFFLIFLYFFYVTYVGYIQEISISKEFYYLGDQVLNVAEVFLPTSILKYVQYILSNPAVFLGPMVDKAEKEMSGNTVLQRAFKYVLIFGISGIFLSFFIAFLLGESLMELFISNLISLTIIAANDVIIATVYGQFRMMDTEYLTSLAAISAGMGQLPRGCNAIMDNTLTRLFSTGWLRSIVDSTMG